MVAPGMVAILTPVAVGFGGGATMLGGSSLAGVTASGICWLSFNQMQEVHGTMPRRW